MNKDNIPGWMMFLLGLNLGATLVGAIIYWAMGLL